MAITWTEAMFRKYYSLPKPETGQNTTYSRVGWRYWKAPLPEWGYTENTPQVQFPDYPINEYRYRVERIRFSTDPRVGFVEIWRNGVKQTFKNGSTRFYYATLKPTQSGAGSLHVSHYRSKGAMASATHYVDQVKVAKTYSEVTPA